MSEVRGIFGFFCLLSGSAPAASFALLKKLDLPRSATASAFGRALLRRRSLSLELLGAASVNDVRPILLPAPGLVRMPVQVAALVQVFNRTTSSSGSSRPHTGS